MILEVLDYVNIECGERNVLVLDGDNSCLAATAGNERRLTIPEDLFRNITEPRPGKAHEMSRRETSYPSEKFLRDNLPWANAVCNWVARR